MMRNLLGEDGWIWFLQYLVDERGYSAKRIIDVIEKPWHWEDEFDAFRTRGNK